MKDTKGLENARHAFLALARHHSLFSLDNLNAAKADSDEATRMLNVVLRGVSSTVPAATALRFALGANEAETMRRFIDEAQAKTPGIEMPEIAKEWTLWRKANPPKEPKDPTEPEEAGKAEAAPVVDETYAALHKDSILLLPTVSITPSKLNPRKHFDEEGIANLANDITLFGIQQPLTVRPYEAHAAGEDQLAAAIISYEIVAGERRWRAACRADIAEVPCIVRDISDAELVQRALSENLQRDNLDAYSEAWGYQKALEMDSSLTQAILGNRYGKSQTYISRMISLVKLPEAVTQMLATGQLDRSHGFALLPLLEHSEEVSALAEAARREAWSSDVLNEKVKARKTAIEEMALPSPVATVAPSPAVATAPASDPSPQPETKESYTQADAKKEFEESGGPTQPRTETPALDAARSSAEGASATPTPRLSTVPIPEERTPQVAMIYADQAEFLAGASLTVFDALDLLREIYPSPDALTALRQVNAFFNDAHSGEVGFTVSETLDAVIFGAAQRMNAGQLSTAPLTQAAETPVEVEIEVSAQPDAITTEDTPDE